MRPVANQTRPPTGRYSRESAQQTRQSAGSGTRANDGADRVFALSPTAGDPDPWAGSNHEGAPHEDPEDVGSRRDTCGVFGLGSGVTAGERPGTLPHHTGSALA